MNALIIMLALALTVTVAFFTGGDGAAALFLCLVLAASCGALVHRAGGEFLLRVFVLGVLVRVAVGTIIYVEGLQEFFGGDALTYDFQGTEVYRYWAGQIQYRQIGFNLETRDWGMPYLVASLYGLLGRNMLALQYVNAVLGGATAAIIFLCARHIFQNVRVARLSAIFVAFYPSLVLWSSQGLKDGPVVFMLALSILTTLRLSEKYSVKQVLILITSLFAIHSLRFYIFYMLVAAVGGTLIIGARRFRERSLAKQFVLIACVGLAMTYLGVLRTASAQFEMFGNLESINMGRMELAGTANSGFGRDVDVSTVSGALTAIPIGMVYLLFAPFPWQLVNLRQSLTLPEMLVWWGAFPFLVVGLWFTLRYRMRQALPILVFTTMLTLAYSVFQGNVGTAYRQRSQLLVFYFIFASVGLVIARETKEDKQREARQARLLAQNATALAVARRKQAQEWQSIADRLSEKIGF